MATPKSVSIESVNYTPALFPKGRKDHRWHYADIGWLPRLNYRPESEYGNEAKLNKLADDFADFGGWDHQQAAIAEIANEDEVKELLAYRATLHAMYKSNAEKLDGEAQKAAILELKAFERTYLDDAGKMRVPYLLGTTCNRRGSILVRSIAHFLAKPENGPNAKYRDDLSVVVPDTDTCRFADPGSRWQAQMRENGKDESFEPVSNEGNLKVVNDLVNTYGKSQSEVRNSGFGATMGLRLYFAVIIDRFCKRMAAEQPKAGWKNIRFLERLLAPAYLNAEGQPEPVVAKQTKKLNPDKLYFKMFNQFAFQGDNQKDSPFYKKPMGLMCESPAKFDKAQKERKDLKRPTVTLIQDWIKHNTSTGSANPPTLKRSDMDTLSGESCLPLALAAKSYLAGDVSIVLPLKERAAAHNFVYSASDAVYAELEATFGCLNELDEDTVLTILKPFRHAAEKAVKLAPKPAAPAEEPESSEVEEEVEA